MFRVPLSGPGLECRGPGRGAARALLSPSARGSAGDAAPVRTGFPAPAAADRSVPHGPAPPPPAAGSAVPEAPGPPPAAAAAAAGHGAEPPRGAGRGRAAGQTHGPADRRTTAPPPPSRATAPRRGRPGRRARPRAPRLQRARTRRAQLWCRPCRRPRRKTEGSSVQKVVGNWPDWSQRLAWGSGALRSLAAGRGESRFGRDAQPGARTYRGRRGDQGFASCLRGRRQKGGYGLGRTLQVRIGGGWVGWRKSEMGPEWVEPGGPWNLGEQRLLGREPGADPALGR